MTAKEKFGVMLKYIRFSTRKGENKTLIEIRTGEDCRLDAVIESVSYPFLNVPILCLQSMGKNGFRG